MVFSNEWRSWSDHIITCWRSSREKSAISPSTIQLSLGYWSDSMFFQNLMMCHSLSHFIIFFIRELVELAMRQSNGIIETAVDLLSFPKNRWLVFIISSPSVGSAFTVSVVWVNSLLNCLNKSVRASQHKWRVLWSHPHHSNQILWVERPWCLVFIRRIIPLFCHAKGKILHGGSLVFLRIKHQGCAKIDDGAVFIFIVIGHSIRLSHCDVLIETRYDP